MTRSVTRTVTIRTPGSISAIWPSSRAGADSFRSRMRYLKRYFLSDGVAPKSLYPLDVERAFKTLDRLKPSIAPMGDGGEHQST